MKSFDEWEQKFCTDARELPVHCQFTTGCQDCKDLRRAGYRQALETINKAIDSEMSFQDIIILVKDELGEQS